MLCCIVQKKISDSGGHETELTAEVKRHIQMCPKCRCYMDQLQMVHEELAVNKADTVDLPSFLHSRVMNGARAQQENALRVRNLYVRYRYAAAAASLVVIAGLAFALRGVQSGSKMRMSSCDGKEWGRFKTLEAGVYQVEGLVGEGSDVLSQPLRTELQLLEEDLISVAEKLDYHLGGSFFAALTAGSS